jgi:hypothetical protein
MRFRSAGLTHRRRWVVSNIIVLLVGTLHRASSLYGAATAPSTQSGSAIRLDEFSDGQIDWIFIADHKAAGGIAAAKIDSGTTALQLSGDFNKGGQFVEAVKDLSFLDVSDIDDVRFKLSSENAHLVTMRLLDATGQTFQRGRVPLLANGQWNDIVLRPSEIIHAEHWGGANDGVWRGPPSQLQISFTAKADPDKKQPILLIADIIADALLISVAPPAQTTACEGNLIIKLHGAGNAINGELPFRIPLTGKASMELLPVAATADAPAGLKLALHNQAAVPQIVSWTVSLDSQSNLTAGEFSAPVASTAYFSAIADGTLTLDAHAAGDVVVPMMGIDPSARYSVSGTVNDDEGRAAQISRNIGGFAAVHRTSKPIKIDGKLDEADWQRAPVQLINTEQQYNGFHHDTAKWKGPQDLSAKVRFLWDDQNLYVAAEVTDDVFRNVRQDADFWAGDSLQFLIDPLRVSAVKGGKYDYVVGVGAKGPQAWCSLTYELAIPWARLSPFKPAVDTDLGLALGLNEDDGAGRIAVMSWFGNVHTKQVDSVGDLMLCP